MKNKYLLGALTVVILGIGILVGSLGQKKLGKPIAVIVHDTVFQIDTVTRFIQLPAPKPDTFYVQEILWDSTIVDTNSILADYFKTYEYRDTLVDNQFALVTLFEKTYMNKVSGRIVSFKNRVEPTLTLVPEEKKLNWYIGGEFGVGENGLTSASFGFGLKDRKENFYLINNNFAYGLKFNPQVGFYLKIK